MKYATWVYKNNQQAGILSQDGKSLHSFESVGINCGGLLDFIEKHTQADIDVLHKAANSSGIPIGEATLLAPLPKPSHDIICVGLNYLEHAKESQSFDIKEDAACEQAVYFSKRAAFVSGPEANICSHNDIETRLDYEAELAVIIGREAKNVQHDAVWGHVFGLCCFNDLSARDLQHTHKQWYFGKSLDTLAAMGPYIVSLDEFSFPLALRICSRVNGETRQDANTEDMLFTVEHIVSELSKGITLFPGDIIATGTPKGVGAGFTPPRCMQGGDTVEIEIQGCGILRNTIV